ARALYSSRGRKASGGRAIFGPTQISSAPTVKSSVEAVGAGAARKVDRRTSDFNVLGARFGNFVTPELCFMTGPPIGALAPTVALIADGARRGGLGPSGLRDGPCRTGRARAISKAWV